MLPLVLHRGPLRTFVEVPFAPPADTGTASMESIELQTLELPNGRSGPMVKVQHHGGTVDLYPLDDLGLSLDHLVCDPAFAHLTVSSVTPTRFERARLEATSTHLRCELEFEDRHGQLFELDAHATRRGPGPAIFIPAPPQQTPRTLRLLHVDSFWLLPKRRSSITLRHGGQALRPVGLPDHRLAPNWSARVGVGNHLVGLNMDRVHPELAGAAHCFDVIESDMTESGDQAAETQFSIDSPLGIVARGRYPSTVGSDSIQIDVDWQPPIRRPALWALSHVRRQRRRDENWTWTDSGWRT